MATFDPASSSVGNEEVAKFRLRRLEPSIQKFMKVVEIDLDRLNQHGFNIGKFNRLEDWSSLNREQINATRTVQQINASIKEIERARNQIVAEDMNEFDKRIEPIKQKAMSTVFEFMDINVDTDSCDAAVVTDEKLVTKNSDLDIIKGHCSCDPLLGKPMSNGQTGQSQNGPSGSDSDSMGSQQDSIHQTTPSEIQAQLHVNPHTSEAAESWEQLQDSLVDLNTLIHEFASHVHVQQEKVDMIEDNVEKAQVSVAKGAISVATAAKLKAVMFPVAGAVIGTLVGGPVGFLAGLKLGAVAGAVGGGVGFASGQLIKKHQNKITSTEMKNLSDKTTTKDSPKTGGQ